MSANLAKCLHEIRTIREAAADASVAYLLRSRMKRAVLSCTRELARLEGLPPPILPGRWAYAPPAAEGPRRAIDLCSALYGIVLKMVVPSEALDAHWRNEWRAAEGVLGDLENALIEIELESKALSRAK